MKSFDTILETKRLILRPFNISDVDASYEMNLDPKVSKYTGDGGVVSKIEIRRRIEEDVHGDYRKYGFGRFAVEMKGDNKFIGFAGLKYLPDVKEVDLGFRYLSVYWGKGIATEAGEACIQYGFEELGLENIIGLVLPENVASIRVLQKLGFTYEKDFIEDGALLNQCALHKNTWKDCFGK